MDYKETPYPSLARMYNSIAQGGKQVANKMRELTDAKSICNARISVETHQRLLYKIRLEIERRAELN